MTSNYVFDPLRVREDFPALQQEIRGKPLVYLDNAASAQTARPVLDAMMSFYERDYANIHRGVHTLSQRATQLYEDARNKIQLFLNAPRVEEIIFVRGTTEAINLVAQSYARVNLRAGDQILISGMEHHSNIVPWQMVCEQTGAILKVVPIDQNGAFSLEQFASHLNDKTKLISIAHISNALGTINPVKEISSIAQERGIPVLIDGAQAVSHTQIDVQDLGCDFYAFSGHKMFGPTGIGVLYAKSSRLAQMKPYQGGGDMITSVSFERSVYADPPALFEAGTPHIAGAIGLGAAADYVRSFDMREIEAYEQDLLNYATEVLSQIPNLRIIGTAEHKSAIISFTLKDIHPHDIGTILDNEGVAIRTGHHCAQPIMDFFAIPATARASFAFYNTKDEVDRLDQAIRKTIKLFDF